MINEINQNLQKENYTMNISLKLFDFSDPLYIRLEINMISTK